MPRKTGSDVQEDDGLGGWDEDLDLFLSNAAHHGIPSNGLEYPWVSHEHVRSKFSCALLQ